ncbi:MAG: terminase large subunit [Halanaerobiales bacterium]
MSPYKKYSKDILSGKIPASKYLIKLHKRLEEDYKRINDPKYPYYFDETVIDKIKLIVNEMTHVKGELAGQKIVLEPWQEWLLAMMYGWKHKETKKKRFKYIYLLTGKGNGKTILDSIILVLDLIFNSGGEQLIIAARAEQSKIAFENIKQFIRNSEVLAEELQFTTHAIANLKKGNTCKSHSGRPDGINGKNLSVAVLDEIAEIKNFEVYNNVLSSCSKRTEYQVVMTTTAQPTTTGVGYEEWKKCHKILDGVIEDDRYLPVLYELDEEDDWRDSTVYVKANPNLNISISLEELERKLDGAKSGIDADEIQLRTLHLNQWIYDKVDSWISADRWEKVKENYETYKKYLTDDKLKNYLCAGALDLSLRNDLSVYTLAYWIPEIRKIYLKHRIYVPKEELSKKMKSDTYLFFKWINEEWVTAIDGPIIRNDWIVKDILKDNKKYNIRELAYDRQFMDDESKEELSKNLDILEMKQTTEVMSQPTSAFYNTALIEGLIDANPVMTWCISNAEVVRNQMGIKIKKEYASSSKRIDPVITAIMAVSRLQYYVKIEEKKKRMKKTSWGKIKY